MYEDYVLQKVSEVMYNRSSLEYDKELKEIEEKLKSLKETKKSNDKLVEDVNKFTHLVSKYIHLEVLTKEVLNDLIHNIYVYQYVMIDGKRVQRIEIEYNFLP